MAFTAGDETAAPLIAIGHEPGMLSHAGAVRAVERLEDQALAGKSQSVPDRRMVRVRVSA